MKAGERLIQVTINRLNAAGQGEARFGNIPLYVDGVLAGEEARIKTDLVKQNEAFGHAVEILRPSPDRVTPPCPVYLRCGGCNLQHLAYPAQLRWKADVLRRELAPLCASTKESVKPVMGMADPWHYRYKGKFAIATADGRPLIGYYEKYSHRVVDASPCLIQDPTSMAMREVVRRFLGHKKASIYNEATGEGLARHMVSRVSAVSGEAMLVLVINGNTLPGYKLLAEQLNKALPRFAALHFNINLRRTSVIFGERTQRLWGKEAISETIGNRRYAISPLSFFQVNPVQTRVLYDTVLHMAKLTGVERIIDVYCGTGSIALYVAPLASSVTGVEETPAAIQDARSNARLNNIANARFIAGKAEHVLPELAAQKTGADVVILDPPRTGCHERVLHAVYALKPQRIIYVSCMPTTLARDLAILAKHGYAVTCVQPVDMFPQTHHIEAVALLQRT